MSLILFSNASGSIVCTAAQVSAQGQPAWVRYHGELGNRVAGDGDLLLDLKDFNSRESLIAGHALDLWAEHVGFDLGGLNQDDGLLMLFMKTLYAFLGEVAHDHPLMPSVRASLRGGEPAEHIRVKVHKDFVMHVLTDVADGPFETERSFWGALESRVATNR